MMRRLILALWLFACAATPAHAGFVVAAISAVTSWLTAAIGSEVIAGWLVKTALSVGLSKLARALARQPRTPGLTTEVTTTGGTTPQKFILGRYATGGQLIAPPMSYGSAGKTPRAYLVYAIALSVSPGATLSRVICNDSYLTFGSTETAWGRGVTGDLTGKCWIDYRDGSQTVAHPDLLAAFAADPDRPWLADMIGPGCGYAVCRFKYDREVFNGLPTVRFEILGIPLYDPRADSTVGGSGSQRWADPATWAQTENPIVMIYNILRGFTLPDGDVWGAGAEAEDLPLTNWFAAMNECDVLVARDGGGTEPQYRAGIEVAVDDEPAAVVEELLKVCSAQIVEYGGVWKVAVGAAPLPVLWLTDDDVIVTRDQTLEPFPGLAATWNGVTASYPEPESLWEAKDAPGRYNTTWEAEDGGRRLIADLQLPACSYAGQIQRVMASYIADERRFRRHQFALPPDAAILEPLDTVAWTSAANGYDAKLFEVTGMVDGAMTLVQSVQLRERDPADYDWSAGDYLPMTIAAAGLTARAAQAVPGWAVAAITLTDSSSTDRRPALKLMWDSEGAEDAGGLGWEIRLAGAAEPVLTGSHGNIASEFVTVADGIIAGEDYEVRAVLIVDRPTVWTDWTAVTAPTVLITAADIGAEATSKSAFSTENGYQSIGTSWVVICGASRPLELVVSAYVSDGLYPRNPIAITIGFVLTPTSTTKGKLGLTLSGRKKTGGPGGTPTAWQTVYVDQSDQFDHCWGTGLTDIPARVALQLIDYLSPYSPAVRSFDQFQLVAKMITDTTFTATSCTISKLSMKMEQLVK